MRNFAPRLMLLLLSLVMTTAAWPAPDKLPPEVQRLLQSSGLPMASFGIVVRRVDLLKPMVALHAEEPMRLASTAKIVTSLAALDRLGPTWRWRTEAYLTGPIINGRLLGDLMIVGGGDAALTSAELRGWMQRMRTQGLREVLGDILLDHSAFAINDDDDRSTPPPAPGHQHQVRPDALMLDEGVLPAEISTLKTASLRGREFVLPPTSTHVADQLAARLWAQAGGRLRGRVRQTDLSASDPSHQRLPPLGSDGAPLQAWSTHTSDPLAVLLRDINKYSNNLAARHVMLSMAPGFPAQAATLAQAQATVQSWLLAQGLGAGDIEIKNGSGLARDERGKPRALAQLLCKAWVAKDARLFVDSLAVAGVDGTLKHRFQNGTAQGQAFLKTGTLFDAKALAGYVRGKSGKVYAVVAIVNHPLAAQATPALDALIEWLALNG